LLFVTLAVLFSGFSNTADELGARERVNPASGKPNILFILTDDQNASTLKHMPQVQSELVEKGRTFENAIHTYPLCCPGRASILSGLYPHNHNVLENGGGYAAFEDSGLTEDNVATWVDGQGYLTGYFGKYLNQTPPDAPMQGWDETLAWGDNINGEVQLIGGGGFPPEENDSRVSDAALSFMEEGLESEGPFFALAVFAAPHQPFHHPPSYDSMFKGVRAPRNGGAFNEHDVSDKPEYIQRLTKRDPDNVDERYRDALRSLVDVDNFVGDAVAKLEAAEELENTYIFYFTDNGSHDGYHRLGYGKRTPYEEDIRFPLIIRGPGIAPGSTHKLAANTDLAPTIAKLAGARVSKDGRSLTPLFDREGEAWRTAVLAQNYERRDWRLHRHFIPSWRAIRTQGYTYIEYETGEKELYDLSVDPYQLENIYGQRPNVEAELHGRLEKLKGCAGDSCRGAEGP
jgi:arylsulfatase A-like enzyme